MGPARRAILVAAPLTAVACAGGAPPRYTIEDLGVPRTQRVVQASAVLGDTLLLTLFETKGDNRLAVVDLPSGQVRELPLAGSIGADDIAVDHARSAAYVAASNRPAVWRVDVARREVERVPALDALIAGERYVWTVAVGPTGLVYAGTYPGGLLVEYDPQAGSARSLGQPLPGRQYVRDVVVGASGTVYCALGTPGALVSVDPRTGRRRTLHEMPAGTGTLGGLRLSEGSLSAGGMTLPVKDGPPGLGGAAAIDLALDGAYRVEAGGRTFEGRLDLASQQNGMSVLGLAAGPDGAIYGPTYYNASVFRVDPATGSISSLGRVHGADGEFRAPIALDGTRLLLPGYNGRLYAYEPARPWGTGNPRAVAEIGEGQHLALAADRDAGGRIALATPPGYGRRGGAVTLLDPSSLALWTVRPVDDQSVVSVAFGPRGRIFAGTSVEVGPGESVVAKVAHLVVLDPDGQRVEADLTPLPDATAITALAPLDDQRILAGTDKGHLFTFDVATRAVQVVARLPNIRELRRWPGTNAIAGLGWRKGLFLVDRESLDVSWIADAPATLVPGIAFDGEGRMYVHDGIRVYRVTRR